jgi:hypothetical protein
MRQLILAACVLTLGCGGTIELSNGDAGTPAPEQQLSTSLPSWCTQICAKLVQCQAPGVDSNCVADCTSTVTAEFIGHGNTCAQYGLNFMNCLDGAPCSDLTSQKSMCATTSTAEQAACSYGDAGASVPTTNTPDAAVTNGVVSCQSGSGIATAGGSVPIGATVCQNNANYCTDGHSYSIDCVYAGNNQSTCTCYRDGAMGVTFGTSGASCPYVAVTNTYCGWQLAGI